MTALFHDDTGADRPYMRLLYPPVIRQCPICDTVVQLRVTLYFRRKIFGTHVAGRSSLEEGTLTTAEPHRGPCSRLCVMSEPRDGDGVLHTYRDCPACAAYAEAP